MKICVHGQIGVGKTTFINNCFKDGYQIIPEPIDQYDLFGKYYLALSQAQQNKGLTQEQQDTIVQFQVSVMFGYVKIYKEIEKKQDLNYVFERSIQEDYEVFCVTQKKYLDKHHNCALKQIAQILVQYEPSFYNIYLKQPQDVIEQRIKQRSRDGEIVFTSYLEQLQSHQDKFIQTDNYKVYLRIPYCKEQYGSAFIRDLDSLSQCIRTIKVKVVDQKKYYHLQRNSNKLIADMFNFFCLNDDDENDQTKTQKQ